MADEEGVFLFSRSKTVIDTSPIAPVAVKRVKKKVFKPTKADLESCIISTEELVKYALDERLKLPADEEVFLLQQKDVKKRHRKKRLCRSKRELRKKSTISSLSAVIQ